MSRAARRVEVFEGKKVAHPTGGRRFYFRVVAGNGEITGLSEAYTRAWSAKRGAENAHPDLPLKMLTGQGRG